MNGKIKRVRINGAGSDEIFEKHAKLLIGKLSHLDISIIVFELENGRKGDFLDRHELNGINPNKLLSQEGKVSKEILLKIYHILLTIKPEVLVKFEVIGYSNNNAGTEVAIRTYPIYKYKEGTSKQDLLCLCKALFVQTCQDLMVVENY